MSDFTVLRSLDGYCLVLDNKRIAGGKPDYRGENVLVDWTTEVAYGPVDDLAAENAKLRELCAGLLTGYECGYGELCKGCTWDGLGDSKTFSCLPRAKARELGVEVDG